VPKDAALAADKEVLGEYHMCRSGCHTDLRQYKEAELAVAANKAPKLVIAAMTQ